MGIGGLEKLPAEVIKKSFKVCALSSNLDGLEDDQVMCIRQKKKKSLLPKLHAFTKRRNRPILSSALLFQKKKWLKKTSHTLFWMTMMTMKSLTLTLNLDHKVFNFSVSLSAVLFRLSFYEIP